MSLLRFRAADVRRVVEHTLAAVSHSPQLVDFDAFGNAVTKPGTREDVVLVHDDGVYLMSAGEPRDLLVVGEQAAFVAYADGCNPHTDAGWYETARALVGGDDFGETLPWASDIKRRLDAGNEKITLRMTGGSVELL